MILHINGERVDMRENASINEILQHLQIEKNVMAVAVNTRVIKKENWESYRPSENDNIECLKFVGGG